MNLKYPQLPTGSVLTLKISNGDQQQTRRLVRTLRDFLKTKRTKSKVVRALTTAAAALVRRKGVQD